MEWKEAFADIKEGLVECSFVQQPTAHMYTLDDARSWEGAETDRGVALDSPHTVHFVDDRTFFSLNPSSMGNWVVLARDAEPVRTWFRERNVGNIAVVLSERALIGVRDYLLGRLNEWCELQQHLALINAMVQRDDGLQAVVDAIGDMYDSPVSMIDNAFNVLCFSLKYFWSDPELQNEQARGALDRRFVERVRRSGTFDQRRRRSKPLRISVEKDGRSLCNYLTVIYVGSSPVASFSVFPQQGSLDSLQEGMLPAIASALSVEMQKSSVYTLNRTNYYTHLLTVVIDAESGDDLAGMEDRLSLFGYKLGAFKRMVLAEMDGRESRVAELRALATQLQSVVPNAIYVVRESSVAFLSSSDKPLILEANAVRALQDVASAMGARLGVSSCFADLVEASWHLDQAKRAIDSGRAVFPSRVVYDFEEMEVYDVARTLVAHHDSRQLMYAPLVALHDHDEATGSSLVDTLYCHLVRPRQIDAVCDALHIHQNTLRYRLRKIREIMGVDLESALCVTSCSLTFALLRVQGVLDRWVSPSLSQNEVMA